ncbi:MAG: hypothetical protein LBV06_07000 [Propionibacteriaceae bacterium]|jgi:hypothetical protein|nr:hypothetical protein [Propionibacteriaceae bacterium]
MHVITEITLTNGRAVRSDSPEFRDALPISSTMLDRLAAAESSDNPGGAIWEAISALGNAVLQLEATGVKFDD